MHDTTELERAQARGAIQGSHLDYRVQSPFSTDFPFSIFDRADRVGGALSVEAQ